MCDSLCAIGPGGALFAKNSDRPSSEIQLIESHSARPEALEGRTRRTLRATHIEIEDAAACALIGSRPDWGWGFEHGLNEHRVAIGNEKIYTLLNPNKEPPALTGMDLVRLGLERARTAGEALDVMTALLERHGQGGVCDKTTGESYFSSFLICDPTSAWVLETSGRSWAAKPVAGSAAISNRITIRNDWTRASADVAPGDDWDERRHPRAPTGHADVRYAASNACLANASNLTPANLATHLRDHGGSPGVPLEFDPVTGRGVTVCMHLRGFQNTTSSIIAELPADTGRPLRAWVAPGQPCVSVFVPIFPPHASTNASTKVPMASFWHAFKGLRDHVESGRVDLATVRSVLDPLELALWSEADSLPNDRRAQYDFVQRAWLRLAEAVASIKYE